MKNRILILAQVIFLCCMTLPAQKSFLKPEEVHEKFQFELEKRIDSMFFFSSLLFLPQPSPYLTDDDFTDVANELGIEVAAIKAVVEIEAGKTLSGINNNGEPLVNYSVTSFIKQLTKNGINVSKARKEHPEAFASRSYEALCEALAIDTLSAVNATFWGMFQIGGFNYRLCGTETMSEFVSKMAESEHSQLSLFANFLKSCNMVEAIRNKDWHRFARMYNGPSYRKRGYHTKLAAAYKKYSHK